MHIHSLPQMDPPAKFSSSCSNSFCTEVGDVANMQAVRTLPVVRGMETLKFFACVCSAN